MANTLLRSGDIKDFKMLGYDGKAAYLVATQIREMFRVKLGKQYADYLAIPQRNDQGNIIDWYIPFDSNQPDGQYDIIPWTSASESEQESALILLKEFEHKVMNLGKQLASNPNLDGDQLLFSRLIYDPKNSVDNAESNLMAIRFPSNQFVYIVNGQPVITFWGFVHPQTPQVNSPFYCLEPVKKVTPATVVTPPPIPEPFKTRPWWKRWWVWLLGLLPLLLLLLAFFLLRGCWLNPKISVNPSLSLPENGNVSVPVVNDEKKVEKEPERELKTENVVVDNHLGVAGNGIVNGTIPVDANGIANSTNTAGDVVDHSATSDNSNNSDKGNDMPTPDAQDNRNEQNSTVPTSTSSDNVNPAVDQTNNLALPADAIKEGSTKFLNGQWSVNGGIQDKATGKPLQLSYNFNDGNGEVTVTRSDGVKCVGKVGTNIKDTHLTIAGNNETICSDNSKYQLPNIQCTPGNNNKANCQGIYNNGTSFPITMKKQ
ncbi:hypothetical protein A9G35_05820 [Gilliamella sp. Choc5-1]|uniref:SrfA family protein n=1 Tax=Gilliamella sp. Choc5-1 TaxID=3120238 RepID=UPI00080D8FAE|nr:SrfA family protein [Gilliamella apicola]OCG46231.1 hypothetical protein A9G35_05820 [Gilliamella apicola]